MKLFTLGILLLILSTFSIENLFGQINVQLKIDTFCACPDSIEPILQGTFGLYQTVSLYPYSSQVKDTLVKELNFVSIQNLNLVSGHYKLIFAPFDTTQTPNIHYFYPYQGLSDVQLSCFFFNKKYAFLSQLNTIDTINFYSSYYGMTHEEMLIPASVISIEKQQDTYYMTYNRCDYYSHNLPILELARKSPVMGPPPPPVGPLPILLSEKQVALLLQFEKEIFTTAIKNNLLGAAQASNKINCGGKEILFYSKWSISESLHKLLSQE